MPKYLNVWEIDTSRMPADAKERMMLINQMMEMTKQWLKERPGSQWGISLDGRTGFALSSEKVTWQQVAQSVISFAPYVKGTIHQVMSIEEAEEVFKSLSQQR